MAKMSQKELLEEGFSDKIRGIAKAGVAGIKQAARQGVRLDTGELAKGMKEAYKGEQPIAVLKKYLENNPKLELVKIDKGRIKKQQANKSKGYFGRITGPKSVILIPFTGTLLGKSSKDKGREYEGASAGEQKKMSRILASVENTSNYVIKEARAAMGYGPGTRTEKGAYKPVSEKGSVVKQLTDSFKKLGIEEKSIERFVSYVSKNVGLFLKNVSETHPNVKFSYKKNPELGVVDVPDEKLKESLSLRDVLRLSSFIILEKETDAELARLLGFKSRQEMRDAFREAGGKRKWLEQNPEAVKAAEALRQRKERGQDIGDKEEPEPAVEEPVAEPEPEPAVEEPKPKPEPVEDDFSDYVKLGPRKFIESLDDETITGILKTLQEAQDGYQIKFEGEKKEELQPSDHTEENFVAEIFRVKEGLKVGDIYREDNPTDIIIRGEETSREVEKEEPVSPIDMTINELAADGIKKPTVDQLVTKIQELIKVKTISPDSIDSTKLDPEAIANKAGLEADAKLLPRDIDKVKQALKELGVIREGTSQKNLLRQLTLLSR